MTAISFWLGVALFFVALQVVGSNGPKWVQRTVMSALFACVGCVLYGVTDWVWRVMK